MHAFDVLGDPVRRRILELLAAGERSSGAITEIIRAEFGMFGEPPPLISDDQRAHYPQHRWVEAHGCNHYTVQCSPAGATLVADALRGTLTSH